MKKYLLIIATLLFSLNLQAKINVSPLYVELSDAMEQVKKGNIANSQPHLTAFKQTFESIESHNSTAGQAVSSRLKNAINNPNLDTFGQLSKALYTFEKEQNPVDYTKKRKKFVKRVLPVYQKLNEAIQAKDLTSTQAEYKRFNTTWTINEKVVRETSLGHYGQIETAMTFIRVAMVAEPANFEEMQKQSDLLGSALQEFKSGKTLQAQTSTKKDAPTTLAGGIKLLKKSYQEFEQDNIAQGQSDIALFVQQWTIFEGEVSTRDGNLYSRVESELPVIMAKGNEPKNMQQFQALIDDLNGLDIAGSYSMFDAMIILLREGVEALLIIMALLTALTAANQPRAKKWVYAGAGLGVIASLIGAVALQQLFPTLAAGTNREILEGAVGIVAVIMMIFVGAWLHSKSSIEGWKKFIDKQVAQALATGSLVSMLALSFLSVFREGAETILFYAGMLPLIELKDFLLGILIAIVLLAIIAVVIAKTSTKLPMHTLFKVMTWLIYFLGFKILGVSVHALQLTNILPTSLIDGLPTISSIGFYPTWETVLAQLVYIGLVFVTVKLFKKA